MTRLVSLSRRDLARGAAALAAATALPGRAAASAEAMRSAIDGFTKGAAVRSGRVAIDLPQLADTGASVALGVKVESPMTAEDHVKAVALFAEANPLPDVIRFHFGPRSGRAEVATRIRLNDSQRIVAIAAMSDGSFWQDEAQIIVTISACVETG